MASTLELLLLAKVAGKPANFDLNYTPSSQPFTTTGATAVSGLATTLGIGTYWVGLKLFWQPSGTIGSTHQTGFTFAGTASAVDLNAVCWQAQASNAIAQTTGFGISAISTSMINSPLHVAFAGWTEIEGVLVTTAGGALTPTIALATGGDDVTTYAGSYLNVIQIA